MAINIKQINQFQLKYLRMAGFLEYIQQVKNIVKTYRDSGEAGVSQLPDKVEAAYTPFVSGVAAMAPVIGGDSVIGCRNVRRPMIVSDPNVTLARSPSARWHRADKSVRGERLR